LTVEVDQEAQPQSLRAFILPLLDTAAVYSLSLYIDRASPKLKERVSLSALQHLFIHLGYGGNLVQTLAGLGWRQLKVAVHQRRGLEAVTCLIAIR
jgi:hypothetical protein